MTTGLNLYSIPPHRAFADALAQGLIRRFGGDPMRLARGIVLVPTNRAKRAITDAFVRASEGGLLLPRMVAVGDPELDESAGPFLDPADEADPVPPAVDPLQRRLILSRLVLAGKPGIDTAEAVRLAGDLARTLDQLLVEQVDPRAMRDVAVGELSEHWQRSLDLFEIVLNAWPRELQRLGRIDLAERRNRLLDRVARRWRDDPPGRFVCAAGITTSAPAIARLLRVVAGLSGGMVVFSGVDLGMDEAEWDMLGPFEADAVTGRRQRSLETHPQFHLKLLIERMGVQRGEIDPWKVATELDAPPARSKAIASAMMPAELTKGWSELPAAERRLSGVRALEVATPAEEAQAIALAMREALETPGRTAALVTPDRALARRVAAHCARWGLAIDDTAGQPLSSLPPGTLLLALAEAGAQAFAPLALLALLKHPLVAAGEDRLDWLEGARALDLALRGPRPAAGLVGIDAHLESLRSPAKAGVQSGEHVAGGPGPLLSQGNDQAVQGGRWAAASHWWSTAVRPLLEPVEALFAGGPAPLSALLAQLRESATVLCGDALWSRAEGRAAAALLHDLEREAGHGPALVEPASLAAMLRTLMEEIAVRPPQGGHPRLAIYGVIEARLQTADLLVLGGLNEGVWPGLPAPDPWLAPRIRAELGLPGLERRIGLAAHDLAQGLGAREVLLTRARRDAGAPTIASRFWLRLEALSGGLDRAEELEGWAREIDDPHEHLPAVRPEPCPPVALRPRLIPVTDVDRLKADPYAFYAKRMLRLRQLDPVDADPSAAWRGTAVHDVLEKWKTQDECDPQALEPRVLTMLASAHPMMRSLWQPRLIEAVRWIVREMAARPERRILDVEKDGRIDVAGVTLMGKFDRIDRLGDGTLGIVDYKTGQPPSTKAVKAGYSLQLGLLGLIAERGGFEGISGRATCFEYWSLARKGGEFGYVATPVDAGEKYGRMKPEDFVPNALERFAETAGTYLTGGAAFVAKLHPEYAPYAEYDQLMRRDEWYGRERRS
ncbi:double-strand break repair protein AddB [Sphingomonas turrisvirgatae]|uniref:Double-strand break repair protein AddB n=1 Tax=Sphingomonas turrisvirgatae TaxID=1888892 RepID=A0A1E3LW23_9SPHN|nr:double-strand break repair protein AddB [Sphingomonas turrisvirgatae]ODP37345.1 double-strand break repair protein AddB [Sphingomonas turrisvirgatae]